MPSLYPFLDDIVQILDGVAVADVVTAEFNIIFLINHCNDRQGKKRGPLVKFLATILLEDV